ncbi:MAG: VOC family protein [Porticoccaceae bacterium]
MPVEDLNHVNINAPQPLLDRLRDFYVDIIGLREGPRPPVPIPGYWLYAGDKPVVHLTDAAAMPGHHPQPGARGHLDHIAFSCTDVAGMETRLLAAGVPFRRNDIREFGIVQLVVTDPAGLDVELNISD